MSTSASFKQNGFTLIEIGVIVPMLIVTVLILYDALFAMLRSSAVERASTTSTYEIRNALNTIDKDVSLTGRLLPVLDSGLSDPYPPTTNGGTWSYRGGSTQNRTLILRTFVTTANPEATDRQPNFLSDLGCTNSTIYYNDVETYDTIYFVENNILYRRRIINTTLPTCGANYQKKSCPSLQTLQAKGISTRDSSCEADDEEIARNVQEFTIQYYTASNDTSALDVYASGADQNLVLNANAMVITITQTQTALGKVVSTTSSQRISKLNLVPVD